jgi:hypothetical protein
MANIITSVEKTFSVAGISNLNGVYKVRFANAIERIKVLDRNGHTDVRLTQLPSIMTKTDAINYLISLATMEDINPNLAELYTDINAVQAFDDFFSKNKTVQKAAVVEDVVDYAAAADALEAELSMA